MRQYANLHLLRGQNAIRRRTTPVLAAPDDFDSQLDQIHQQSTDWLAQNLPPTPPIHRTSTPAQSDPRQAHSGELIRGWADVPLLPEGIQQAKRNGRQIRRKGGADGIVTPALRRSIESARATSSTSGVPVVAVNPNLATRGWGALDGQPLDENLKQMIHYQKDAPQEIPPGGGESTVQYFQRFLPEIHSLLLHVAATGQRLILVNHHSGIKAIEAWIKAGMPPDYSADLNEFVRHDGEPGDAYLITRDKRGQWEIKPFDLSGRDPIPPASIVLTRHGKTAWNGAAGESDEGTKGGGKDAPAIQPAGAPAAAGLSTEEQIALHGHLKAIMKTPRYSRLPTTDRVKIQNARLLLESRLPKEMLQASPAIPPAPSAAKAMAS